MIDGGSRVFRHDRGEESVLEIVKYIMSRRSKPYDLQQDIADRGLRLNETAAVKEAEAGKKKQSEMYEKKLANTQEMRRVAREIVNGKKSFN